MINITVKNFNRRYKINEKFAEGLIEGVLKILKKPRIKLDLVFLSDKDIRPINKKYKGSDSATDVLSFNLGECGQILISSDAAMRNCSVYGTSFENELVRYVIHGILHFFGYLDHTKKQRLLMSKKEDSILEKLCANPKTRLSKVLTRR